MQFKKKQIYSDKKQWPILRIRDLLQNDMMEHDELIKNFCILITALAIQ